MVLIDIRRLACLLSGKVSSYKMNRLVFMDLLQKTYGFDLQHIEFWRRQAKEYEETFYFLVLDMLQVDARRSTNAKKKFEFFITGINSFIPKENKIC